MAFRYNTNKAASQTAVPLCIVGVNLNCPNGSRAAVWDQAGTYTFASSREKLNVVSSSGNDAAAGTGAKTITIYGLDSAFQEVVETISLNGLVTVTTSKFFYRINFVEVATAGAGAANAGNITITGATSGLTLGYILAGVNTSRAAILTVPLGQYWNLTGLSASIGRINATTAAADFELYTRETTEPAFRYRQIFTANRAGNPTSGLSDGNGGLFLPEGTDIYLSVLGNTASADVYANLNFLVSLD